MSRSKNSKSEGRTRDPERARLVRAACVHGCLALLLLGGGAAGVHFTRRYVERNVVFPTQPPAVVLKNQPVWMTDFLARQIAAGVRPAGTHSAFDHQMLIDRVAMLKHNPWISNVRQVRRAYGKKPGDLLEIDCDYRAPIALVRWGNDYWLVDGEGVKLPERFAAADVKKIVIGRDGHTNIRIIDGVRRPVPQAGYRWGGDDLAAGLQMVKTLYGRPFVDDVVKVNVANFGGRVDPKEAQLVLGTKYAKEVRWGRPPADAADNFIEVSTERKLDYLRWVYEEFGRVDASQDWIDIRYDIITYPGAAPTRPPKGTHANGRG